MESKKTKSNDSLTFDFMGPAPAAEPPAPVEKVPEKIEEFLIRDVLGRGGFGTVFLAYDTTLQRDVALKIPHHSLVSKKATANLYLREARAIASLDHPNIIPVYRAASTPKIACYIVTKRIRGCDLSQWAIRQRPTYDTIAILLAQVADAIAFAHKHGVVHRDIKPSNILIDEQGRPFVADFGLALRDVDPRGGPAYVGTPAYMSPEQARGEGHRVDGRSDIYSMAVVMYELLTGKRPFQSSLEEGLYEEIMYSEPIHPARLDTNIPSELSRICLKGLSKSINERYPTGEAFANDVRQWLSLQGVLIPSHSGGQNYTMTHDPHSPGVVRPNSSALTLPRVVPKGLRPFDTRDADFFLQLLPGPRDRDGMPEIVRFWLSKFDAANDTQPVSVGVIYGPSGCGKTSLARAGIIPRLPDDVVSIYIQATAEDTERTLQEQIVSRLSLIRSDSQSEQLDVVESFAMIRRLQRRRVVIFIDQFEQWLFANPDGSREALVQALRQCDGEYLQCILMVRDDFWMGVTRLMQSLDQTIAENINATAVDLFDESHARRVLTLFGTAYGKWPESIEQMSPSQNQFLDQAVQYLQSDGRVICVQLALLSEMLKNRSWDHADGVFDDGGIGLGMRFLEETFDSELARRRTRIHAEGAHSVLRALLPEATSRIKGSVRTKQELANAASYRDKNSFRELLAILDREMHLITPTDRIVDDSLRSDSGNSDRSDNSESISSGYQLTHDFLIAPIRQWIEYRNRSTKKGKARLRLEEFSDLYRIRPLTQSLPTFGEYFAIRRHTDLRRCNDLQRRMMSAAKKRHLQIATSWLMIVAFLFVSVYSGFRWLNHRNEANASRMAMERLLGAKMNDAVVLATSLKHSDFAREEADRLVKNEKAMISDRVRASLVLADSNSDAADLITQYLLGAPVDDVVTIAKRFNPNTPLGGDTFDEIWSAQLASKDTLIRAACMLANDETRSDQLRDPINLTRIMKLLLNENPLWIQRWSEAFKPIGHNLVPLLDAHLDDKSRQHESLNASNLLVAYAENDLQMLISHLPNAFPSEVVAYTDAIASYGESGRHAVQQQWRDQRADDSHLIELAQPWGSPWWCVGNHDAMTGVKPITLSESLSKQLSESEAAIGKHAILVHKLGEENFEEVVEGLVESGYRIAELVPYQIDDQRFWMVLSLCDGIDSKYCIDVSAEELFEKNKANRDERFFPDTLQVYRHEDTEKYTAVWIAVPEDSSVVDADIYVDVHHDFHEDHGWGPLVEQGIEVPRTNLTYQKSDGENYFASVRWKLDSPIEYREAWHQSREMVDDLYRYSPSKTFLSQQSDPRMSTDSQHRVTAVWWSDLPVEVNRFAYQPRREHLRQARIAMAQGYYPVSISTASSSEDSTPQLGSVWWRRLPEFSAKIEKCNRLQNLLAAMFKLGDRQQMASAMQDKFPEATRGAVIDSFEAYELPADWLVDQLGNVNQESMLRRSCAMALATYSVDLLSESLRHDVEANISHWYTESSDPGLRSAIQSIQKAWGIKLQAPSTQEVLGEFRSVAGDRMVVIQPDVPVWLGSLPNEPGRDGSKEPRASFRIDRPYAIASQQVTTAQYRKFQRDHEYAPHYTPTDDCPVIGVSWFDAAKYCRWLSEQEGIPESQMCYPPMDEIKPGMQLKYDFCKRIGYRLPTEVEWEFACRGGTHRNRWFGFNPQRLGRHAWTAENSGFVMHPVASLLPNDYGLFDMLGNAMQWCQASYVPYPTFSHEPENDPGALLTTIDKETRMATRGGAILYQPLDARASQRNWHSAYLERVYLSFRIARTMPAEDR